MNKARNGFIKTLPYLCLVGVIALGLMTIVGTGGGGGAGDTDTSSAGGGVIQLNVVMGPIVGANVFVYPLDNRDLEIASGVTEDSEDITEAGHVSLEIPPEYSETPLLLLVIGGVDIDADDDGVRDTEPTNNDITLEFAFPTPDDLEDLQIVANPLLLFASSYVLRDLWGDETITDPEEIRIIMRRVAKALIHFFITIAEQSKYLSLKVTVINPEAATSYFITVTYHIVMLAPHFLRSNIQQRQIFIPGCSEWMVH